MTSAYLPVETELDLHNLYYDYTLSLSDCSDDLDVNTSEMLKIRWKSPQQANSCLNFKTVEIA